MAPDSERDFDPDLSDGSVDDDFNLDTFDNANGISPQHQIDYESRFQAAKVELTENASFTNDGEAEEFLYRYDDIAAKSFPKVGGNLLHAVVDVLTHFVKVNPIVVEPLVRRIVERWPSHLEKINKDGHNPLSLAVRSGKPELVGYMVSACADRPCLETALSRKSPDGHTCLHSALKQDFSPSIAKMLIENATDEALALQDDLGMVPMHHAMAFNQCDVKAELIDLLIDRDLKALKKSPRPQETFLDRRAKSGRSVYGEHLQDRKSLVDRWNAYLAEGPRHNVRSVSKQSQPVRTAPRDLQDKSRGLRQGGGLEPDHDPSAGDYGGKAGVNIVLDEGEIERRKRREAEKEARKKAEEELKKKADETKGLLVGEGNDKLGGAPTLRTTNTSRSHEPAPNTPLKRRSTASFASNLDQKREKGKSSARPKAKSKGSSNGKDRMPILLKHSEAILLKLKLHYMRTRSAEMAISFLYGNNIDDVQISFDYDKLPRNVTWSHFIERFGENAKSGLRLDPVLQYVTFPHVQVTVTGRWADREKDMELQTGIRSVGNLGRKDMQHFFQWLYAKGVRHIIRVSVEDSGDSGEMVHSDQAIQESLKKFVVESLDWRKTDLDPETILSVSSEVESPFPTLWEKKPAVAEVVANRQLKDLSLRWGGSNAVLRGWGEPEGLAMLPYLRKIVLFTPPFEKRYDNEAWIRDRIHDFNRRLNESREAARTRVQTQSQLEHTTPGGPDLGKLDGAFGPVKVVRADLATDKESKAAIFDAHDPAAPGSAKRVHGHRWLESTARFAVEMTKLWNATVKNVPGPRQGPRTQEGLENDVVLALIDDGVDVFDTVYPGQILEGKSFDFHGGKVRPPYSSAHGHGTVMASMIQRVCPMVKIYPIRLKTYENAEGKNMNIDAGYAAQAIQAALDKKAKIISMSWTIPMPEGDTSEGRKRLHEVLAQAVQREVLMFCSAPDGGKFTERDYPSGPWRNRFFRIGAAGSDGTVFQWTPDDITYVVPGVDVIRDQVSRGSSNAHSTESIPNRMVDFRETGSSVATALAAGLAAMILYCVKASILTVKAANNNNNPLFVVLPDNAVDLMARPDQMKQAFGALGRVTNNKFVQVWDELEKVSDNLAVLHSERVTESVKIECTRVFMDFAHRLWSAANMKQEY